MRRQKRDQSERAFQKGYMAGVNGKNKEQCPHEQEAIRQQWLTGWREGRTDQWDGYTGVSGLHKVEIR
ncbi:ribosome modulation factor [Dasania sp. GY-MA-18]|uniref:Ribosome modulation factor n=1 Tax=Dasania phycosphaerae TaxID=2950436 RepID=A0A9J6RLR6_9GAMM|nr:MULTISPECIES: ribosome modulation factor [Dasania]MCR8922891.1 ribosome modulation factor [Dasania sp. GY-MA-18]MCZ0865322.1 ribosome modulation factor [Dasania phycosphaerae]MCZ0869047.1 ribosome modulation factor [Dasania phycosphaerae]